MKWVTSQQQGGSCRDVAGGTCEAHACARRNRLAQEGLKQQAFQQSPQAFIFTAFNGIFSESVSPVLVANAHAQQGPAEVLASKELLFAPRTWIASN
eukprot:CAMPEP_0197684238 /NCGR_PEP_ID=MMETSP1338-20131121/99218_1 /TAXON_ID=43686 ORGANISM="Pelagodinium beii, Strain RCC1491" /NCGR_SAMPLE_ID=MMETSP1338 /ASSEMBLY_ACC=CAM_ASM_000754 /LENGTH=96 /DNA_ID=CAMNT_0043265923 /DNA_START=134 /DNA_END=423 /DNA_ORIENTATION=-